MTVIHSINPEMVFGVQITSQQNTLA